MANSKISALTSATTPLAGTEVLPIVQSGATVKVANNDLRPKQIQSNATSGVLQVAGPAAASTRVMTTPDANFTVARTDAAQSFTGDQTLNTGNLIQGTAAKGINFTANTPAAGMTSQLLNWYEEGTVILGLSGSTTNPIGVAGMYPCNYTRVGRMVTVAGYIVPSWATPGIGVFFITGLPFNPQPYVAVSIANCTVMTGAITAHTDNPGTKFAFQTAATATDMTWASAVSGNGLMFTAIYQTI